MTSPSDTRARRGGGFTLIEMLMVIGIIALIAAILAPQALHFLGQAQAKAEMQTSTREIAAALRKTRSLAITRGHTEAFVLDLAHGAFRAGAESAVTRLPAGLHFVLFTTSDQAEGDAFGSIKFFPDGSSTGGGVRLSGAGIQSNVLVDWLTGRVSVDAAVIHALR